MLVGYAIKITVARLRRRSAWSPPNSWGTSDPRVAAVRWLRAHTMMHHQFTFLCVELLPVGVASCSGPRRGASVTRRRYALYNKVQAHVNSTVAASTITTPCDERWIVFVWTSRPRIKRWATPTFEAKLGASSLQFHSRRPGGGGRGVYLDNVVRLCKCFVKRVQFCLIPPTFKFTTA